MKIFETIFDLSYLISVIAIGIYLVRKSQPGSISKLFGWSAILLGGGDAFHLLPRVYAMNTSGLEAHATTLGAGKFITSITMTFFYILVYWIWRKKYQATPSKWLDLSIYGLASLPFIIELCPENMWLSFIQPVSWGIARNIPFAVLGTIIIVLFFRSTQHIKSDPFRWMWLAVLLSFGFYTPVVLWSNAASWVGALMMPKTLTYVSVVLMGLKDFNQSSHLPQDEQHSPKTPARVAI